MGDLQSNMRMVIDLVRMPKFFTFLFIIKIVGVIIIITNKSLLFRIMHLLIWQQESYLGKAEYEARRWWTTYRQLLICLFLQLRSRRGGDCPNSFLPFYKTLQSWGIGIMEIMLEQWTALLLSKIVLDSCSNFIKGPLFVLISKITLGFNCNDQSQENRTVCTLLVLVVLSSFASLRFFLVKTFFSYSLTHLIANSER